MQTKIFLAIIATAVVAVALIGVTFALVSAQLQNSTQTPTQPYNYGYCPPAYNNGTGIYIPYPQTINPTPQTANQYGYGFGMGKGMCGRYW